MKPADGLDVKPGGTEIWKHSVQIPTERQGPSERLFAAGLQKLDIKLFVTVASALSQDDIWDRLVAVFGRWRQDEGEELIDLQDYSHVPNGPGVVLVSKRWVFSLDTTKGRPGILLSTRRKIEGTTRERLRQATRLLVEKAIRLLAEEELKDLLEPRVGELEITINDRVLFPNTDAADAEIRPEVEALLDRLYGSAPREVERAVDPSERLSYAIRVAGQEDATLEGIAGKI